MNAEMEISKKQWRSTGGKSIVEHLMNSKGNFSHTSDFTFHSSSKRSIISYLYPEMDQLIETDEDLNVEESMSLPNIVTKRMARFFMDSASASSANGNLLDLGLDSETILTVRSTYIILRPKIGSKIFFRIG